MMLPARPVSTTAAAQRLGGVPALMNAGLIGTRAHILLDPAGRSAGRRAGAVVPSCMEAAVLPGNNEVTRGHCKGTEGRGDPDACPISTVGRVR